MQVNYPALGEFRYQIRRFLHFSEQAARAAGVEPRQHQLLLALRGLPQGKKPTVGTLAERLQIEHHSAVELIDRLEERGLVRRYRDRTDRRQVRISLTRSGLAILERLSLHHLEELQSVGPALVSILNNLLAFPGGIRSLKAANEKQHTA